MSRPRAAAASRPGRSPGDETVSPFAVRSLSIADALREAIRIPAQSVRRSLRTWIRRLESRLPGAREQERRASLDREFSSRRNRAFLALSEPAEATSPLVCVVVLNRDGEQHLESFFSSFHQTIRYPNVELMLVDHASTDGSVDVIRRWQQKLPITLHSEQVNRSFSYSNNRAAERATGALLLFANNDLIFTEDVIEPMVRCLEQPGVGLVGLRLMYPLRRRDARRATQHLGIRFAYDASERFYRPYNIQRGDSWNTDRTWVERFPAVTAALLLCRRADFLELGGFDERYLYGYEDVDLGLRYHVERGEDVLALHGVGCDHDEGTTQRMASGRSTARRLASNRAVFRSEWGAVLRRGAVLDRLRNGGFLVEGPLTVGFAVSEAHSDTRYGDYYTAMELGAALEQRHGCEVRFLERGRGWEDAKDLDVLVAMLDAFDPTALRNRKAGLVTVAWCRNWFERWVARPGFDAFDVVLCSSQRAADWVSHHGAKDTALFPLATNFERFAAGSFAEPYRSDVCFAGSRFNEPRHIERSLRPESLGYSVAVYGHGWEGIPGWETAARGFLPYSQLPRAYASTRIVVDDANRVTRPWGSVNSRVFDALAAGTLVITNGALGSEEVFHGRLPTYGDEASLRALLKRYLEHDGERRSLVDELRAEVARSHTYEVRADQLLRLLRARLSHPFWWLILVDRPAPGFWEHDAPASTAQALKSALDRGGCSARIQWREPSSGFPTGREEVVVQMGRATRGSAAPDQILFLWLRDDDEDPRPEDLARCDAIVCSPHRRDRLGTLASGRTVVEVPPTTLPSHAADPEGRASWEDGIADAVAKLQDFVAKLAPQRRVEALIAREATGRGAA